MAIDRTTPIGPGPGYSGRGAQAPGPAAAGPSFGSALQDAASQLQFSSHAQKRIDRRDLDLSSSQISRLNTAVDRAAQKGARNSVVMLDGLAVVVDVRDRTVVTAMNANQGKEKVFTNIDSVVIA
jgi:flagellar operon protein